MERFKDDQHRARFQAMWRKAARPVEDLEWRSALYVLSAVEKSGLADCIHDGYIDFDALHKLASSWSTSERALCYLAHELFNGWGNITISQLFRDLDPEHVQIALEGLKMRYFDS